MPKITFVNDKKEIEVLAGANLREEALKAGVEVYSGLDKYLNCRGHGLCGTCRVLVKAGMERARQQGKRIGRPRVTERSEFVQRYAAVIGQLGPGGLSRRQAAQQLGIGYATLKRLLDARTPPDQGETPASLDYCQESTPNRVSEDLNMTSLIEDRGDKVTETAA